MKRFLMIIVLTILLVSSSLYTVLDYNKSNKVNTAVGDLNENRQFQSSSTATANMALLQGNKVRLKAQDFKLKDLDGNEVALSNFKGKKVFLNFWATWCPPCKAEMPDIEKLYGETKDSDLVILAIDMGENKETVKSFIVENGYNFRILLDTNQEVARKYNISSMPTSFFIDKEGYIRATHIGAMNIAQMKIYVQLLDR